MSTKTSIVQTAVTRVGAEAPASLADDEDVNIAANALYDTIVGEFLCRHDWTFATKTLSVAKTATVPLEPWFAEYPMPSGCINVRNVTDVYGRDVEYELQENVIRTKVTDDNLYVIHNWLPTESRWPGDFVGAVTEELVGQLLETFEERVRGEAIRKIALGKLVRAASRDKRQKRPIKANSAPLLKVWYNRDPNPRSGGSW